MIGTAHEREQDLFELYPVWKNDTQWAWFRKNCERFADRVFLIDEEKSYTYGDMLELTGRVSKGFYACGIRPGTAAAVSLTNRKELVASVFALSRLGCMTVMVNTKIADSERDYILKKTDTEFLITERPSMWTKQILVTEDEKQDSEQGVRWRQMLERSVNVPEETLEEVEHKTRDPERTSTIIFTSGSTSRPKGVMLTDNMLLRSSFATANTRHMEIGRRIYVPIPFYHAMGYVEAMLTAVMVGGSVVISRKKYTPREHLLRMQKYEVNDIVCISSVMIRMMMLPMLHNMQFPNMHAAYWAGACPAWVWEKARSIFDIQDCGNGYGMTECGSTSNVIGSCDPREYAPICHGKIKTAGTAAYPEGSGSILSMKIVSDDGRTECAPGECGEILMKGIAVAKGYYNDPEATARLINADGWMHSGDLGKIDEEGYLTFLGRKDDMFKVNGENVSPKYVEDVLLQHENVRYAEVVGIPHETCGEAGAAFIEFFEEYDDAVSELQEYIKEKLAGFQQPYTIFSMQPAEWPKTVTGKVSKMELKKMALDKKEKQSVV